MTTMTQLELRRTQMSYAVPLLRDLQEILGAEVIEEALKERLRRKLATAEVERETDLSRMEGGAYCDFRYHAAP